MNLRGGVALKFPAVKSDIKTSSTEYKHYQDADLVSLEPKQALAGIALPGGVGGTIRNFVIVILLLGVAVGLYWFRRARARQPETIAGLAVPAEISPFSVVAFLRRIQHEHAPRLNETARESLQAEIREIESAFFSNCSPPAGSPDLESIARKWVQAIA